MRISAIVSVIAAAAAIVDARPPCAHRSTREMNFDLGYRKDKNNDANGRHKNVTFSGQFEHSSETQAPKECKDCTPVKSKSGKIEAWIKIEKNHAKVYRNGEVRDVSGFLQQALKAVSEKELNMGGTGLLGEILAKTGFKPAQTSVDLVQQILSFIFGLGDAVLNFPEQIVIDFINLAPQKTLGHLASFVASQGQALLKFAKTATGLAK